MRFRYLIGLFIILLLGMTVSPLGSSTQQNEIGLIPAKLTVQWASEKRKTTEGEEGTHSYRSYRAENEEKETLDATFSLEVPDIDYWGKPDHIYGFGYAMGKVAGPEHLEVSRAKRVKLPNTKLLSYEGQITYAYRFQEWIGPIMASDCETTERRKGSGQLSLDPYGFFQLQFMGEDKGHVQVVSGLLSIRGERKSTCDVPASTKIVPPQQRTFSAVFPMMPNGLVLDGWSAKIERTPTGIKGTASYHNTIREEKSITYENKTMTWNLALNPEEVEAGPGGPYEVVRGQSLTLDGSRSKGKNLKYEWTFTPKCPNGVASNKGARKEGVRPTVVLLCDTLVTLKVTDGKKTDTKDVLAVVTARNWETKILKQIDAYLWVVGLCRPDPHFGRNVCALDGAAAFEGEQKSGHFFHKKPDQIGWEKTGYILGRISDHNGPFDGWWYVKENLLSIQRAALINRDLNAQTALYEENRKRGYHKDFDTLIDQVKTHERMHSILIEEALPQNDPAKKIEAMFHPHDKDALKRRIDIEIIQKADESLRKATSDDNVKERLKQLKKFNRPGKVLLKVCNTERYEIFSIGSFALIGD